MSCGFQAHSTGMGPTVLPVPPAPGCISSPPCRCCRHRVTPSTGRPTSHPRCPRQSRIPRVEGSPPAALLHLEWSPDPWSRGQAPGGCQGCGGNSNGAVCRGLGPPRQKETEAPLLRRPPRQQLEVGFESGPLPAHVHLGSWPQLPWEACCCPRPAPASCILGGSQMAPVLGLRVPGPGKAVVGAPDPACKAPGEGGSEVMRVGPSLLPAVRPT